MLQKKTINSISLARKILMQDLNISNQIEPEKTLSQIIETTPLQISQLPNITLQSEKLLQQYYYTNFIINMIWRLKDSRNQIMLNFGNFQHLLSYARELNRSFFADDKLEITPIGRLTYSTIGSTVKDQLINNKNYLLNYIRLACCFPPIVRGEDKAIISFGSFLHLYDHITSEDHLHISSSNQTIANQQGRYSYIIASGEGQKLDLTYNIVNELFFTDLEVKQVVVSNASLVIDFQLTNPVDFLEKMETGETSSFSWKPKNQTNALRIVMHKMHLYDIPFYKIASMFPVPASTEKHSFTKYESNLNDIAKDLWGNYHRNSITGFVWI